MPSTAEKRPRPDDSTPLATHSFKMVKLSRPSKVSPVESPVHQDTALKTSNPTTYGPIPLPPLSKANNRPALSLQVQLLPTPSLAFPGVSPITSFLSSSHSFNPLPSSDPEGVENSDRCGTRDEHLNYRITQGVKYDVYSRNEVPYSILYDNVTPESGHHSCELMQKLMKGGSPSLLSIPTSLPVHNALDLGCGDGHWIVRAAQTWGVHGTNITGINIPLSTEEEQTTLTGKDIENVTFLCHNFIIERLPFPDNSFDYVRLNGAVAVIPGERWDFVLSEVYRILSPGGRLELIHDQLCFSFIGPETPVSCTFAPSTKNHDSPPDFPEAAKRKGAMKSMSPQSKKSPYEDWEAEMRNCSDVERLYLDMLTQRYGVHPQPHTTLVDTIQRRFGGNGLVKVSYAHICLPSHDFMTRGRAGPEKNTKPKKREFGISITIDWGQDKPSKTIGKLPTAPQTLPECLSLTNLPPVLSKKAASLMGVAQLSPAGAPYQPPGVVVVHSSSDGARHPMTFFPMSPTELDMHANKHVHSVISAKLALEAHIDELRGKGKPSMSREALDDALWQYAMFRRKRFNWPEMDPFEWESESECDGESEEQMRHFTLPDTQTTDGLTPVRLFEIFEVIKST